MNLYKNIILFLLKPLIWLLTIFHKQAEKVFFTDTDLSILLNKSYKQLNVLQRAVLLLSYKNNNFKTASIFIKNISYVNYYRLLNYPIIHSYILDTKDTKTNFNKKNKIKNYLNNDLVFSFEKSVLFNKYIFNLNKNLFWLRLNSEDIKFIEIMSFKKNFTVINLDLINGFYLFLSSIDLKIISQLVNKPALQNDGRKKSKLEIDIEKRFYLKILNSYNTFYRNLNKDFKSKIFYDIADILFKYSRIVTNKNFLNELKKTYLIKYKPTDVTQFLKHQNFKKNPLTNLFIRKNKIFNKGRYSRNRQLYRTGVYWCLWMNIIAIFGLYYYFYRFVFNFGYMYLPLLILILSIFGSRIVKYRFYNLNNVVKEFLFFLNLVESLIKDFFKKNLLNLTHIFKKFFKNIKIFFFYFK